MEANVALENQEESYLYQKEQGVWAYIKSWLFTVDHKRIGLMYLASVLFMFLLGGVFAVLLRLELLSPGRVFMDAKTYNQIFTLHGIIMTIFFIIPSIPASLGNFVLPLQLGAKDVAFPRLNLFSWYLYIIGFIVSFTSMLISSVDTGWTFYTPYSTTTDTSVIAMGVGIFIAGFSSILTGVNFVTTVHKLRAPGMSWMKMPLFVWSLYATAIIQALATPVLGITILLLAVERLFQIGIFSAELGGDPVLFQHFFWFYSHPAVYIMILPAMGIMSELITAFSKKRIFGYKFVAFSSVGLALVSFLVWGHHMFAAQSQFASALFSILTFLVAIPSAIKLFNWIATMYYGSIDVKTPFLWALAFIVLFIIGGISGLVLGVLSTSIHFHDTYYVVAHFHYVMVGSTAVAFVGGIHYWWPKMFGRMYSEIAAVATFFIIFIGFNLTYLPQFLMGAKGMPRRYYTYLDQYQVYHQLSTYGSWLLAIGVCMMIGYLLASLFSGPKAPANPWGAKTLEWTIQSPPIEHNFHNTPIVTKGPYDFDEDKSSDERSS